tara:strand:+ start:334 stop:531 length:198 start_codon:yes stop_codon:yes gene_type:complete
MTLIVHESAWTQLAQEEADAQDPYVEETMSAEDLKKQRSYDIEQIQKSDEWRSDDLFGPLTDIIV